ncbi:hypothetical protein LCI18_002963 [Fusarium solani-melongenae]|uniref:Uncharacterized protein n=1 Tax=Fusarium solani subsp. cucurbitae TaxID=2747967 RepID=A0ACD3YVY7_FUSSC|nr:hypothetical protein LCI18_002963 [Fusarium solani-melongenae]
MSVPFACLPLDSGSVLPKPGRAHVMGSDCHMFDTTCVEGNGCGPDNDSPRVRSVVLGAADVQSSDDVGVSHVRASAISEGDRSSLPTRHHHVGHIKSAPDPTSTPTSSIVEKWVVYLRNRDRQSEYSSEPKPSSRGRLAKRHAGEQSLPEDEDKQQPRRRSPPPVANPHFQQPSSPANDRSRARNDQGRPHNTTSGRQLWTSDDESGPKAPPSQLRRTVPIRSPEPPSDTANQTSPTITPPSCSDDSTSTTIPQPETRPISQDQLVAEVKGIYAGLVMVETKCIEVDNAQAANTDTNTNPKLDNDQWQTLIALHRTLLHEHHDFFLASQHPSASPALRRLASKYSMPAHMWRHGIHSFLELLRHRLPASLEHMLTFLYLAYSIVALLYETVPAFEDTWIECLGDLGRYRMAVEDDHIRDREIWTGVSRHWYSKASDVSPTTGRLYHHLAILARPHALQQLSHYAKSLCVLIPFASARESIMALFDPGISAGSTSSRLATIDAAFVKAHGTLSSPQERLQESKDEFFEQLELHIPGVSTRWRWPEPSYTIAVLLASTLFEAPPSFHVGGWIDYARPFMRSFVRKILPLPLLPPIGSNLFDPATTVLLTALLIFQNQGYFRARHEDFAKRDAMQDLVGFHLQPLLEVWFPNILALASEELKFRLRLRYCDTKLEACERYIQCASTTDGFLIDADTIDAGSAEVLLLASPVHAHGVSLVAARILTLFRILWLASVSNLYLLFGGLEWVLSCHCSGGLPTSILL